MKKLKEDNFMVIHGFMVTELNLKGNELLLYAIIFGFSQGDNTFNGSLQYLAEWTNSTKQGVIKSLKSLIAKGYLAKEEKIVGGMKCCEYHVVHKTKSDKGIQLSLPRYSTKFNRGSKLSLTGYSTKFNGGSKLSLPNNKYNIKNNNIKKKKTKKKKFKPPTLEEVKAYCKERNNNVDAQRFYDYYSAGEWTDKNGEQVVNWKQKMISNWEKGWGNNWNNPSPKPKPKFELIE